MFAITFLQFVTAATGVAACIAIIRGLAGNRLTELGNFYLDLTRATVRVFLPLALLLGTDLLWQGTPMTFEGAVKPPRSRARSRSCPRCGGSGSRHQAAGDKRRRILWTKFDTSLRKPDPARQLRRDRSITIIPMAMVARTLGYMVGRRRLAVVVFATMLAIYIPMVVFGVAQEAHGNPAITAMGVDQSTGSRWRERGSRRRGAIPRCGRSQPPSPPTAPSTPCTTP